MKKAIVELENISKSFAGVKALESVDLALNGGEICCLVGENGSGKSTLIKIMAGVIKPDNGVLRLNGVPYRNLQPIDAIRAGIQVIYQDLSLFPNLTVGENIALSHLVSQRRRLVDWREVGSLARETAAKIEFDIDVNKLVGDLSVADKQLVAIARALVQGSRLIIMDEPTTALTHREVSKLLSVIKTLQRQGIAILFVSHKLDEVLEIAERVVILRNGRKVADGEVSQFDSENIVYYMTGKKVSSASREDLVLKDEREIILKVENMSRTGEFEDVSFELAAGEILGLTGLLGAGRTNVAMALFGLTPAHEGEISVCGKKVKIESVQDAMDNGISYVPEDRLTQGLFFGQPVNRNMVISSIPKFANKLGVVNYHSADDEVGFWMDTLMVVASSPYARVETLSGGNQQKVVLARWLAMSPRCLILNRPTVGVDVGAKEAIHKLIRQLAAEGIGILLISDDIQELVASCHRVLLMRNGRIVDEYAGSRVTVDEIARGVVGLQR